MIDFSARSLARVWAGTLAGTLFCVGAALFVDSFNFPYMDGPALTRAIIVNIGLPTGLAGPLLFLLLSNIRQLAIAHHDMAVLASTDSLTAVLNRGAFNMLVDTYLQQARAARSCTGGSLLVVDADHFKSINDRFGHQAGDRALKFIAASIKGVLRPSDMVGRIGGEEFGVFLPQTTRAQAMDIAERIRLVIYQSHCLSPGAGSVTVSIGGVSFKNGHDYESLFRLADKCLYEAKHNGRNQVLMMDYIGQAAVA